MHLPELDWQIWYGRAAWTVVMAAALAALLPLAWRIRALSVVLLALCAALMALPQAYSPSYWLVLAFQWPSVVLAGCCLMRLLSPRRREASLPSWIAVPVAIAGIALYLDAVGWLSLGLYDAGFGPYGAPLLSLGAAFACVFALARGRARPQALIVLGAVALYSILRLPTGNLWDALLDPLLWGWAVLSLIARMRSSRRGRDFRAGSALG